MTDKPESEIDATTTLKDLDLNFIFMLPKTWFQEFRRLDPSSFFNINIILFALQETTLRFFQLSGKLIGTVNYWNKRE